KGIKPRISGKEYFHAPKKIAKASAEAPNTPEKIKKYISFLFFSIKIIKMLTNIKQTNNRMGFFQKNAVKNIEINPSKKL
ncbi:MAG: hypothetical protein QXQ69_02520, partial [Candidatus Aenigmatarchaeota archaeon]